jgi:hypothetical protein
MPGKRFFPWDLLSLKKDGHVSPPREQGKGWPSYSILRAIKILKERGKRPGVWWLSLSEAGRRGRQEGFFRETGDLYIKGSGPIPSWVSSASRSFARTNPVGVFGRKGGGGGGGRSTTSALQPVTMPASHSSPSAEWLTTHSSWLPRDAPDSSGSSPEMLQLVDEQPSGNDNYTEMPQTVDEPPQAKPPERDSPYSPIKEPEQDRRLPSSDDWLPKTKSDIYSRAASYTSSAAGSIGSSSTKMKDLIDPQLWRLSNGGSVQAMTELMRRGPKHYQPAFPNPDPRAVPKGEKDSRNHYLHHLAMGLVKKGMKPSDIPINHPKAKADLQKVFQRYKKIADQAKKNPRGLQDVEFVEADQGREWAQYDLEKRGQWYRREHRTLRNIPTVGGAHNNPTPTRQHGFTAIIGEDGGPAAEWARWAQDREFIPRRFYEGIPGMGPSRQNPRRARRNRALPTGAYDHFLSGSSWPIWRADTGFEHAKVAIQWMTMGRGRPGDYPKMVRKMARIISPKDPRWADIWEMYERNRAKIARKADKAMPTLASLRRM